MRELTDAERALRDERQARLERMLAERMPVLVDFFERLGHTDPAHVLNEPDHLVRDLDAFLAHQVIGEEDRAWILARVAYFLGELFTRRHGGAWFVDTEPDSRHFLRIVVGAFTDGTDPRARFDPFEVAASLLDQPAPRTLAGTVGALERELPPA